MTGCVFSGLLQRLYDTHPYICETWTKPGLLPIHRLLPEQDRDGSSWCLFVWRLLLPYSSAPISPHPHPVRHPTPSLPPQSYILWSLKKTREFGGGSHCQRFGLVQQRRTLISRDCLWKPTATYLPHLVKGIRYGSQSCMGCPLMVKYLIRLVLHIPTNVSSRVVPIKQGAVQSTARVESSLRHVPLQQLNQRLALVTRRYNSCYTTSARAAVVIVKKVKKKSEGPGSDSLLCMSSL
jgi:hypothetical protein